MSPSNAYKVTLVLLLCAPPRESKKDFPVEKRLRMYCICKAMLAHRNNWKLRQRSMFFGGGENAQHSYSWLKNTCDKPTKHVILASIERIRNNTYAAFVRFLPGMNPFMFLKRSIQTKTFVAIRTSKGFQTKI